MRKTMIYLPENTYLSLRLTAEREERPMAELVRIFVETGLKRKKLPTSYSFLKKIESYKIKGGKKLARKINEIYK